MNHALFSGNLTRDPEVSETKSGTEMAKFGVAVEESFKDASGEWQTRAHFVDCTLFGGRARIVAKAKKGDLVTVSGKLNFSQWETDDGQKRSKLEIVAQEVVGEFQYRKASGSIVTGDEPSSNELPAADASTDDDIPF